MLLIALMAVTTISAQRKQQVSTPTNVIKSFNFICDLYGQKNSQVYSVNKNPNTGIIESKEVITPFVCKKSEPCITMIADDFHKDEPVCYQLMHIANGNLDNFSIKVATGNGNTKTVCIRTWSNQNMWYMAVKNPDNPQLRDVYAIVWENMDAENVKGKVFMITSLRPDLFEKNMEKDTSKTFTLDGRMGDDISDSLYVFYMADTYEELNRLVMMTDSYAELKEYMLTHDNILPMPVSRDRRFNISVDIDKRMGGRIRTVMPDGSLCKLWTNIDMVPGETYHITTHNGFYNGDYDYDRRVGLYSGKSMFEGKENDDVELTGGYNNVVADTVLVDDTANVMYALLRIGTSNTNVDNIASGGIYTVLDEKGTIVHGCWSDKTLVIYDEHPLTKEKLIGFKVPMFKQALELCKKAALVEPHVRYVGWDVAITDKGPIMVEGNQLPGYDMAQNYYASGVDHGLLPKFEEILKNEL